MDEMTVQETLSVLAAFGGTPIEEQTLRRYVNQRLAALLTIVEFKCELENMKAKGWVNSRENSFRKNIWFATEKGLAQHQEMTRG
jgi:hypothetical protein